MSEPRTKAGRRLLATISEYDDFFGAVLDIEDEAARLDVERLSGVHRLLMPPHPNDVWHASALCSCGEWQYDEESPEALGRGYRDILRAHAAHQEVYALIDHEEIDHE